jgi:pilus assembly protein CpaB
MQRRLIAAIAAVVLAGIGAILLFNYVASADTRAMEGQQPTEALVVIKTIQAGTLGNQISGSVEKRLLPKSAIVNGTITSLDEIATMAATSDLQVGEQIIRSRFAEPGTSTSGEVTVQNDQQLVSVQLESQRALAGALAPGNKVAVYVTYSQKTQQILQNVLVARVGSQDKAGLVTLALPPAAAQRVILAMEAGKIWLVQDAKDIAPTTPLSIKDLVG